MAFDSIGNLKFMFLMVNLKFLEKVMLEKKTEFCLCIVSTVQWEKNTSVLWQPIPMFWDICVIFMMFDSGRPIFGIFMEFLWDCCGVRFWSAHFWDFYGICVGFLWNCCGILWDCYASGWPKTTEQIVELPWLQSK
jgi:hypothetical protein